MYQSENIALFETLYGKNLISLGGTSAIDNMFSDISLSSLHALDVGFGLGGVAFYLAKKYHMQIAGVELHSWMVEYATKQIPENLLSQLKFFSYSETNAIPAADASFDLVYSKGVFNHVHDKKPLFQEIKRVLKPQGLLVIADWIHPIKNHDPASPLVNETQASYSQVLSEAGFTHIEIRDDSRIFLSYVNEFLLNAIQKKDLLVREFGTEMYSTVIDDHQKLITQLTHQEKFAVRIKAS